MKVKYTEIKDTSGNHVTTLYYADKQGLKGKSLVNAVFTNIHLERHTFKGANLSGAQFTECSLTQCSFVEANCSSAQFSKCTFTGSTFKLSDTSGATFSNCDFWYLTGNGKELKSKRYGYYSVVLAGNELQIGCKTYTVDQWMSFDDTTIDNMSSRALNWCKTYKSRVLAMINNF